MLKFRWARGASQAGENPCRLSINTAIKGAVKRAAGRRKQEGARRAAKKRAASQLYRHTNGRLVSGARTCH